MISKNSYLVRNVVSVFNCSYVYYLKNTNCITARKLSTNSNISSLRRVTPFYSLIEICFDKLDSNSKSDILNNYIKAVSVTCSPFTTKNDLPINAAKILISLPLLYFTLSTSMVNAIFQYGLEVTMPLYTWTILDKYFVRVERENFGDGPGLYGNIVSYSGSLNFKEYLDNLFTNEFLYNSLVGTDFGRLVSKVEIKGAVIYNIDPELRKAIDSRLLTFNNRVYSHNFLTAVSNFYNDFSSKFYTKTEVVSKLPARRVNTEVGVHCFRNHSIGDCYIYHKSVDPKFDTPLFLNIFLVLAKIFGLKFLQCSNVNLDNPTFYGNGLPGNNDIYIDITSVRVIDALKTLLSISVNLGINADNKRGHRPKAGNPIDNNIIANKQNGKRDYSTFSYQGSAFVNKNVLIGKVYFRSPITSFGYSRIDYGNGRILLVDTS